MICSSNIYQEGFPDTTTVRTGGCVTYRLISSNTSLQALSQTNETLFFVSLVKG